MSILRNTEPVPLFSPVFGKKMSIFIYTHQWLRARPSSSATGHGWAGGLQKLCKGRKFILSDKYEEDKKKRTNLKATEKHLYFSGCESLVLFYPYSKSPASFLYAAGCLVAGYNYVIRLLFFLFLKHA